MTNEEAIKHLEFMAKGYQNLLINDERCLEAVGKGYKGEIKAQASLEDVYKMQIETLNVAIEALQSQKTAHWITWYEVTEHEVYTSYDPHCKCSACETEYEPHSAQFVKYCRVCGAKMERIEDE